MDKKNLEKPASSHRARSVAGDKLLGSPSIVVFEIEEEDARMFCTGAEEAHCESIIRCVEVKRVDEIARSPKVCLIVLGCKRTGNDEFWLLGELRKSTALNDIPIVVLAREALEADIRRAFELGADRFFLKPTAQEDYVACSKAIASHESNLDPSAMHYEKFPEECERIGPDPAVDLDIGPDRL